MKADESADYAGRWRGRFPTGLFFSFFWGLEVAKTFSKKLGFRLGSVLVILSIIYEWAR